MRNITKGLAALVIGGTAVAAPLWGSTAAQAATTAPTCQVGVTTHTEYKWVPDVINAGPTQWSLDDQPANTHRDFPWKGKQVSYHRDGTKSAQVTDTTCPTPTPDPTPADVHVSIPSFGLDTSTCSVTVPFVKGVETRIYGVNGYDQNVPITEDVTVTGGLDGASGTAPQFWIGYSALPGYVLDGSAPTHFDFYNGDDIRDC